MTCNKTEKLEKTKYQYINNCCKSILVTLRIMRQCKYLNEDMIDKFINMIDEDVDTIQDNCIDLLEDDKEEVV